MPRLKNQNNRSSDPIYSINRWGPKKPESTEIPEQSVRSGGRIKKAKTIFDPSDSGKITTPTAEPEAIKRPEKAARPSDQEKRRPNDVDETKPKKRGLSESTTGSRESSSNGSGDGSALQPAAATGLKMKIKLEPKEKKRVREPKSVDGKPKGRPGRGRKRKLSPETAGDVAIAPSRTCKICQYTYSSQAAIWTKCANCNAIIHKACNVQAKSASRYICLKCNKCAVCLAPISVDDGEGQTMYCAGSGCYNGCHYTCAALNGTKNRTPSRKWHCNECKQVEILEQEQADSSDDSEAAFEGFQDNKGPDGGGGEAPPPPPSVIKRISDIPDASKWTSTDVYNYFVKQFPNEAQNFQQQEIDGMSLLLMRRSDVIRGMGFRLGPALRIYKQIVMLQTKDNDPTLTWF